MKLDRSALKARARQQLGGNIFENNWVNALLFSLFVYAIETAAGVLAFIPMCVFLLGGPMEYASAKMYTAAARGKIRRFDLKELKSGFRDDFGGNFILYFLLTIILCLWCLIPIAGPFIAIYKGLGYGMVFYIKADHPDYNWKRCFKESEAMMAGQRGSLFILNLSFIGWIILACMIPLVGIFFLLPYMNLSNAHFYAALRAQFEAAGGPRQFDAMFAPAAPQGQPPMGAPRPMNGQPPMGAPRPAYGQPPMGAPRPAYGQPPMGAPRPVNAQPPVGAPHPVNAAPTAAPVQPQAQPAAPAQPAEPEAPATENNEQ